MVTLISIIIPVYNSINVLRRCVESLFAQTYPNFEILMVDDGSTDGSSILCDELAKKDSRIRVFHKTNAGVGSARNFALERIKGEVFGFIDADDWVEPNYLEVLFQNLIENKCEVSACQFERNKEVAFGAKNNKQMKVLNSPNECVHNYICPPLSMSGMVWNKLYKTDSFVAFRFSSEISINEDCLYTYEIMSHCNRACITDSKLYHWFVNDKGACHSKPTSLDFSAANVFLTLLKKIELLDDKQIEVELKKNYINAALFVLWNVSHDRNDNKLKEVFDRLVQWKTLVWYRMSFKDKVKYILCVQSPGLKKIARKLIIKKK